MSNIKEYRSRNQFIDIYEKVSNDNLTVTDKLALLTKFKGHVKKELVNPDYIPTYFKTLLYIPTYIKTIQTGDGQNIVSLLSISHSALCYLIKRVTYQSPNSINNTLVVNLLTYFLSIQDIINNHKSNSPSLERKFWLLSNKAIETIYLTVPLFVEDSILKFFNEFGQSNIILQENLNNNHLKFILLIIDDLTRINLQSNNKNNDNNSNTIIFLEIFLPHFTSLLNNEEIADLTNTNFKLIVELINDILSKYLNDIVFNEFKNKINNPEIKKFFVKQIISAPVIDNKTSAKTSTNEDENVDTQPIPSSNSNQIFDLDAEYNILLNDYKAPQLSNVLNQNHLKFKSKVDNIVDLSNELNNLLVPFHERKETESNWKSRQQSIITIREKLLINEQVITDNQEEFVACLKDINFIGNISKSLLSLRTSLSLNSCQLLKELLELMGDRLSISLLDQIFSILKQLLSSTKKISSQMALHCLMVMLMKINEFHNKLFQNSFILMNEKGIIPRNASTIFLRIFIIKFSRTAKFENNQLYVEEWLKKGLSDAQIIVRDSMKLTFWYFYKSYPEHGKNLINKSFTAQLKRSVESSIPLHLGIDYEKARIQSNNSSSNNSRRSSLLSSHFQSNINSNKRKYPSYAQPTQSSSILQKINSSNNNNLHGKNNSGLRSTSENIKHSNDLDPKRLKVSGSLNSGRFIENNPLIKRKVSAPPTIKNINQNNNNSTNSSNMLDTDNISQFDITDEINSPHSNYFIKKYLENPSNPKPINENRNQELGKDHTLGAEEEANKIIQSFETYAKTFNSNDNQNSKYSLQLLQNFLLRRSDVILIKETITKILPHIRQVLLKSPLELKNLMSIPIFIRYLPLNYSIELYSICNLNVNDLVLKLDIEDTSRFVNDVCHLFVDLTFEHTEKVKSIYYMKYREKIFNFTMDLLIYLLKGDSEKEVKNRFNINDNGLEKLLHQVFEIYGNEFDNKIYFDLLYQFYLRHENLFLKNLVNLNLVSQKLKISSELRQRDTNFELPNINKINERLEQQNISKNEPKEEDGFIDDREDDTNVKRYMEMTMVNPFKQNASLDGALMNHSDNESIKIKDDTTTNLIDNTENKLSQMTKVISIYQPEDNVKSSVISTDSNNTVKEEEESDKKRSDIDLSDIFAQKKNIVDSNILVRKINKSKANDVENIDLRNEEHFKPEQEHTVKFSTDPPKVINEEFSNSVKENENDDIETSHDIEILSPESTMRPILSSISSVTQVTQPRIKTEESLQIPPADNEILNENFSLIMTLPHDSLTVYELNTILAKEYNQPQEVASKNELQFSHLLKAVNRIKNGTFTMKHLIYLLEPFINLTSKSVQLITWLENQDGFNTLLEICLILLRSTDDTILIPTNMTSKSLIVLQCLLITNDKLTNLESLSSNIISEIWDQFILLIEKLSDYNNEIYILLMETRQLMIKLGHFDPKGVTRILNKLLFIIYDYEKKDITQDADETDNSVAAKRPMGMVGAFLLGTLSDIFKDYRIQVKAGKDTMKRNQYSEVIQTLEPFTDQKLTEWRYESCNTLACIYHILCTLQNTQQKELDEMFACLSNHSYRLIKFMASRLG